MKHFMTNAENPLLKNVSHLENTFNFDNPIARKSLSGWFQTFNSVPFINNNLNGRLEMLTDLWRECPILEAFESFHKTNKESFSIMQQYQSEGKWFHTERRAKEISNLLLVNKAHPFYILIENFARKGHAAAVTNLLYLFDKQKVDIPWHISYEALIWAELIQARDILEKEGKKPESKVRLINVKKQEKESEAKHDPFYHLYSAYLLLREFEAASEV